MADSFPGWLARVRKDPLGPAGYNRILDDYRWAEDLYGTEHILGSGEHNATEVPREVGSVYITGGPTGNIEGFRYATGATRSALGTIQLAINSSKYAVTSQMAFQICNLSENGINKPCITSAVPISTSQVEFYSKTLTSALAAPGNAWVAEDASFAVAIHGPPLFRGNSASMPAPKVRGGNLTAPNDWNQLVTADSNLRSAFLAEHSVAGKHIGREVARSYGSIYYAGGAYRILDSSARNPVTAATTIGLGHVKLTFNTAWSLSAQPFMMVDYARSNGGAQGDIIVGCCPRSLITTTAVEYFFYRYTPGSPGTWTRTDTDFFTVVHGGP